MLVCAGMMFLLCGASERVGQQIAPIGTLRTTELCIELANAESESLRAYNTSNSYVEKTAFNEAERDAGNLIKYDREKFIEKMKSGIEEYKRNNTRQ